MNIVETLIFAAAWDLITRQNARGFAGTRAEMRAAYAVVGIPSVTRER